MNYDNIRFCVLYIHIYDIFFNFQLLLLRKLMTETLMNSTNDEIRRIAIEMHAKEMDKGRIFVYESRHFVRIIYIFSLKYDYCLNIRISCGIVVVNISILFDARKYVRFVDVQQSQRCSHKAPLWH